MCGQELFHFSMYVYTPAWNFDQRCVLCRSFPPELLSLWKCARAGRLWLEALGIPGDTFLQYYQPREIDIMRHVIEAMYPEVYS